MQQYYYRSVARSNSSSSRQTLASTHRRRPPKQRRTHPLSRTPPLSQIPLALTAATRKTVTATATTTPTRRQRPRPAAAGEEVEEPNPTTTTTTTKRELNLTTEGVSMTAGRGLQTPRRPPPPLNPLLPQSSATTKTTALIPSTRTPGLKRRVTAKGLRTRVVFAVCVCVEVTFKGRAYGQCCFVWKSH